MEVLPVVVGGTGYNPNSIVGTSVVSTFIITAQPGSDKDLIIRIALSFRGKIKNISVKGVLTIGYNYLNLPSVVSKSSDLQLGIRLRRHRQKTVAGSKQGQRLQERTDYCGEFFYENDTLKFINHEKGRVVMTGTTPEYQYHLKDHLGNVRLTFTTKDEVDSTTATLEPANAAEEQNKYLRMEMARKVHSALFDHTNGGLMGYSQRLNGTANEKFGIARSLSVMPGDTVSAEVFVKYVDPAASNTQALTDFLSAIDNGTAPSGTVLDGINYPLSTSSFLYAGLLSSSPSENAPKAYLNWLVFDRDYNFKDGGYAPITTAAKENGDGVDHERLFTDNLVIKEPGYVYLYLSNENETPVEVFFDDFSVKHKKSPVVQMDDYYPFGLTFNSYSRENSIPNMYQYNGKEKQDELDLGWLDYGARMYMSDIGRFDKVDRASGFLHSQSPYVYAGNTPNNAIDYNGDYVIFVNGLTNVLGYGMVASGPDEDYWGAATRRLFQRLFNGVVNENYRRYENGEWSSARGPNNHTGSAFSSAKARYKAGKRWARRNYNSIIQAFEAEKQTNPAATLNIVSHSQGAAFAEGIATIIAEKSEGAYKVNTMVHLQPSSASFIPASVNTVDTRLAVYTFADVVANKFGERMENIDAEIEEDRLRISNQTEHRISVGGQHYNSIRYAGMYDVNTAHGLNNDREQILLNSIEVSLNAIVTERQEHRGGPRYER